jgi:predicted Zn finger-like uncharacterized protein
MNGTKLPIVCPACGARGTVDAAHAGREVRCRHCKHSFNIPRPGEVEPQEYALADPIVGPSPSDATEDGSAYVPAGGREQDDAPSFDKPRRSATRSKARSRRRREEDSDRARTWLIRLGIVAALGLVAIALLIPNGTMIAGGAMASLGGLMVLAGFSVGAYAAFREDSLYGLLYLLFPLYTAYYLVTRWDDLWPWFACSTAGAALVTLGSWLALGQAAP